MPKNIAELLKEKEEQVHSVRAGASMRGLALDVSPLLTAALASDKIKTGNAAIGIAGTARQMARDELNSAMRAGFDKEMQARAKMSGGLFSFTFDEKDEQFLSDWDILGHSVDEITEHISRIFLFNLQSLFAGSTPPEQLPAHIQKIQTVFANQLASNAVSAQLAGSSAAGVVIGGLYESIA